MQLLRKETVVCNFPHALNYIEMSLRQKLEELESILKESNSSVLSHFNPGLSKYVGGYPNSNLLYYPGNKLNPFDEKNILFSDFHFAGDESIMQGKKCRSFKRFDQ